MVETSTKKRYLVLMTVLPALLALTACGDGEEEAVLPLARPSAATEETFVIPDEPVVITIGNLTDKTGPGSNAIAQVDMALEDMIAHFNSEGLIHGVELKIINYDIQFDPARDIPGYEWLKERGADLLFSPVPSPPVTLKARLAKDKMLLFAIAATEEAFVPPGYVFCPGNSLCKNASYTILKWITENDPDFPKDRPAKIGGAFWTEAYGQELLGSAERYVKAHPEQYEWEGGFLTGFTFIWGPEVEALKDCDYVLPPVLMQNFVKEYRSAGHTAKFICTDAHMAFLQQIREMEIWDQIDKTLVVRPAKWWTDEGPLIDLARELLLTYRNDDAEEIIRSGVAYLTVKQVHIMFELIAETVTAVGAENFNSQALYDVAQSFSVTVDGIECDSFNQTKRTSTNYMRIYEVRAAAEDFFRVGPEWVPVVLEP